jgi:hypothetical protein
MGQKYGKAIGEWFAPTIISLSLLYVSRRGEGEGEERKKTSFLVFLVLCDFRLLPTIFWG